MKTRIDTHDDVALRDEETIAFWAMAHHDDQRIVCIIPKCGATAEWCYRCTCGTAYIWCTGHRLKADELAVEKYDFVCDGCDATVPNPIPWLPM